jgi:hypothetical protein
VRNRRGAGYRPPALDFTEDLFDELTMDEGFIQATDFRHGMPRSGEIFRTLVRMGESMFRRNFSSLVSHIFEMSVFFAAAAALGAGMLCLR